MPEILEHTEDYCKAQITDNAGRTQLVRSGIIVSIENDEVSEIHLLNLTTKQRQALLKQLIGVNSIAR